MTTQYEELAASGGAADTADSAESGSIKRRREGPIGAAKKAAGPVPPALPPPSYLQAAAQVF